MENELRGILSKSFGREVCQVCNTYENIADTLLTLLSQVLENGGREGNTKEVAGYNLALYFPSATPISRVKEGVTLFYKKMEEWYHIPVNVEAKLDMEYWHYRKLEADLLSQIQLQRYLGTSGDLSYFRRRLVAHSPDCISAVQILPRKDFFQLAALIRSSDMVGLFPIDILGLFQIMKTIQDYLLEGGESWVEKILGYRMDILLGSAHVYLRDDGSLTTRDMIKSETSKERK